MTNGQLGKEKRIYMDIKKRRYLLNKIKLSWCPIPKKSMKLNFISFIAPLKPKIRATAF